MPSLLEVRWNGAGIAGLEADSGSSTGKIAIIVGQEVIR
jgi:hypothetical protein